MEICSQCSVDTPKKLGYHWKTALEDTETPKRKKIWEIKHLNLEKELCEWFCHACGNGIPTADSAFMKKVHIAKQHIQCGWN